MLAAKQPLVQVRQMYTALFLVGAALSLASYMGLCTRRGGWIGIPLGLATIVLVWIEWSEMPGTMELVSFLVAAVIAGTAAIGLPRLDAAVGAIAGASLGYAFLFLIDPHDSPVGYLVGASSGGFATGSLLSFARSLVVRSPARPSIG